MLKSQIGLVLRQTYKTFASNSEVLIQNLEILKSLLDKTTAEDVNLQADFSKEEFWQRPHKAPVSYIDIVDNNYFTVGIFVLKPNTKLPLHNHPAMYGLIKVILGKVKITSYSINTESTRDVDSTESVPGAISPAFFRKKEIITAELAGEAVVDTDSDCCLLEPEARNLHEIESIDGPAAFIDILAPPYDTIIPNVGPRKCSYYSILNRVNENVFKMLEVDSPSWFWTDSFPYLGPNLSKDEVAN